MVLIPGLDHLRGRPMKVTIYQFMVLDPGRAERRTSRRWGTREGIQSRKDFAEILILEHTAKQVDASAVDSTGFTRLDFESELCGRPRGRRY